jgi:hypothetical protein
MDITAVRYPLAYILLTFFQSWIIPSLDVYKPKLVLTGVISHNIYARCVPIAIEAHSQLHFRVSYPSLLPIEIDEAVPYLIVERARSTTLPEASVMTEIEPRLSVWK